uniref:Uncharacterized protein n=1 Tax=Anopheles culicifacies TaxID=139723 RepID=A0A182M8A6_9DIPT
MCTRDCYRVFGYFLGFLWMASAVYYTTETIELLKLMRLRCDKMPSTARAAEGVPDTGPARLQFSDAMIAKVCDFYTHLDVFTPYHIITTVIKMMPGMLLVGGIFKNNITLVKVFALYGLLEELYFVIWTARITLARVLPTRFVTGAKENVRYELVPAGAQKHRFAPVVAYDRYGHLVLEEKTETKKR